MSRADAYKVSSHLLEILTGNAPSTFEADALSCSCIHRRAFVKEWTVSCGTSEGDFFLRIDALTQRAYAINRVSDEPSGSGEAFPGRRLTPLALFEQDECSLTYVEAERRARHYASLIGLRPNDLKIVKEQSDPPPTIASAPFNLNWHFTYQSRIAPDAKHLVVVLVRRKDGQLYEIWNYGGS